MINWNPLVNSKFSIDGEHGLQEGYVNELKFESGKSRTWLTNTHVPAVYPSLSLALDNTKPTESGKTEYEEFMNWFNVSLRYGVLPFYVERLKNKNETGVYKFIPGSLHYDRFDGIIIASFGLEEQRYLRKQYFLVAHNGDFITANNKLITTG